MNAPVRIPLHAEMEAPKLHWTVKDITGQRFGRWTVKSYAGSDKKQNARWNCVCDCGIERDVARLHLIHGNSKSCGCLGKEARLARCLTHGGTKLPEYRVWHGMKKRCYLPSEPAYKNYGGRGIEVDARWREDFSAFLADMGRRPSAKHTIERINNDGNYAPDNCVWATKDKQANNTRANHMLTVDGQTMTLAQTARRFGIRPGLLSSRLSRGIDPDLAVRLPIHAKSAYAKR